MPVRLFKTRTPLVDDRCFVDDVVVRARPPSRRSRPAPSSSSSSSSSLSSSVSPSAGARLGALPDAFVNDAALDIVADLVGEGETADAPLDAVVARFLKARLKGAPDADRAFVVEAAHALWRTRRLGEAIARVLLDRRARTLGALFAVGLPRRALAPHVAVDVAFAARVAADVVARSTLAERASLPEWLCARLVAKGGEALALSSTSTPPQTLRVNTLRASRDDVQRALAEAGIATTPTALSPMGLVVDGRKNVFATPAFLRGDFEVQDEGSQLIAALAQAAPGQRVVDGCAGAGGKTLALAASMQNKGTLIALDVHGGRLQALRERAARAGVSNLRVHDVEEEAKVIKRLRGSIDVVVVDAPCSGTGVLRRNPDTGWRLGEADVARLVSLQGELLRKYAALVRPGGTIVYATCSLLHEENRGQIDRFLAEQAGAFVLAPAGARLRAAGVVVDDRIGDVLDLDPVRFGTDGFFAAALTRVARTASDGAPPA